ncbi:MAG: aminopeptidase [Bacteroides sp. 43_108]|nr:MAG: aminopeptidase [Bacteroides sp. 43_108]
MLNIKHVSLAFTAAIFLSADVLAQTDSTEFMKNLCALPGVSEVKKLETTRFPEKYVLKIRQNLDTDNAEAGTFNQRVIVGYVGEDRPTVIVTEGYNADYAMSPSYIEELSDLFDANMVFCEYRYFGESMPKPTDWNFLTVENSLGDLHNVNTTFRKLFKGKWISTGISKGGQTTMFYRTYYPNDVDVSVSYVAPLNKSVEDGRHEPFLRDEVGTKKERKAVHNAQLEMFKRKSSLVEMLEKKVKADGLNFNLPLDEIFDYELMEYPFAFWQWGTPVSEIPSSKDSDEVWFEHLMKVSGPDYFSVPGRYLSFNMQALRELGYYGYEIDPDFKKYCSISSTKDYLRRLMIPESMGEWRNVSFDPTLYNKTVEYLKNNDPKHIFIYGEIDPWTASGVAGWLDCSGKQNMRVYVQPRGSHKARIGNMPEDMKAEIMERLNGWLK